MESPARDRLVETIRRAVIGANRALEGPYGPRRIIGTDCMGSGRALSFIEDWLRDEVGPICSTSHAESSASGRQTRRLREDAHQALREAVGGTDDDVVLFCGSGATGAIARLVRLLGIALPPGVDARYRLIERIPRDEQPVVFIGPYEHPSHEMPWRESIAQVVTIDEDADGRINPAHLARELRRFAARPLKIGSFSATSNVTGIVADTRNLSVLLHKNGALAVWDFAAVAPHVAIDMNLRDDGPDGHLAYKDAIFLAPHRLVGGPGAPGVLVAKRSLLRSRHSGGSSSPGDARSCDTDAPELREEGSTPDIVGSIRAGLVFRLKSAVGPDVIHDRERTLVERAIARWRTNPNLKILGNIEAWRLSMVSFMVRHGDGFLHHEYVVTLLDDLFGVQARSGCACEGPYGQRLLGTDFSTSRKFEQAIVYGMEGVTPGWARVSFDYFQSEAVFSYVLDAIDFIADHGWKLLPQYGFDAKTGIWRHRRGVPEPAVGLGDLSYADGRPESPSRARSEPDGALAAHLDEARCIVDRVVREARDMPLGEQPDEGGLGELRWFPLAWDALAEIQGLPHASQHILRLRRS